jgi:hypothetical protein
MTADSSWGTSIMHLQQAVTHEEQAWVSILVQAEHARPIILGEQHHAPAAENMFMIGGTQKGVHILMQLLLTLQHLGTWGSDIMHPEHAGTQELHSMQQIRLSRTE